MPSITIPDIHSDLERRLRRRAAENNRSIEVEAEDILRSALVADAADGDGDGDHLLDRIRRVVEPLGGIELELPQRGPIGEPPDFK